MTNGKINRKYFALIWLALVAAFFMYNAYSIYLDVVNMTDVTRLTVVFSILKILFSYGVLPAVIAFVCALIVWQIGAARYVRCISRNDFCYTVMAVTACVKFFVGLIQVFSILEPNVYAFTSTVLDFALMAGAMLATFFFIFVKQYKFNPVEKHNAYRMWATVYMVVAGLGVIGQNGLILLLADGSALSLDILTMLYSMGYYIFISDLQIGMSIAAICIYAAYLVLVIVLGIRLRGQAEKFRNPETRGEFYAQYDNKGYTFRGDADRVFGDGFDPAGFNPADPNSVPKKEEHVFDEFDL